MRLYPIRSYCDSATIRTFCCATPFINSSMLFAHVFQLRFRHFQHQLVMHLCELLRNNRYADNFSSNQILISDW